MSPSCPSQAASISTLAICTLMTLSCSMLPLGVSEPFQREYVNDAADPAHHHVLRHPRAARDPALDDVRACAADAPRARAVLASRGEQALRGAQEAGRARPREGHPAPDRQAR